MADRTAGIDAIRYRMGTGGYIQADLGRLLGSRQRASDILSRKRALKMRMAWKLHQEWDIPAEALIAPPRTRGAKRQGPRRIGARRGDFQNLYRDKRVLALNLRVHAPRGQS